MAIGERPRVNVDNKLPAVLSITSLTEVQPTQHCTTTRCIMVSSEYHPWVTVFVHLAMLSSFLIFFSSFCYFSFTTNKAIFYGEGGQFIPTLTVALTFLPLDKASYAAIGIISESDYGGWRDDGNENEERTK